MSYLVAGQHFPGREAASALEGRCHRSPGQATPQAERRPGYSAYCARVHRPLWPQSAQLTGAKEAMEPHLFLFAMSHAFSVLGIAVNVIIERPLSRNPPGESLVRRGRFRGVRFRMAVVCLRIGGAIFQPIV